MDRIIRGITKDKSIRFFAIDATETVQEAVTIHNLSMTNSVIMGRMISATLMMAADLKSDKNVITLKIDGDGPAGVAIVTARKNGNVKGYAKFPEVEIPLNEHTKTFDIQNAIGNGTLTIIKDLGMKSPYIGQIELKYGTIAKDLTFYFAKSEQIPSSVGLGVLVMPEGTVKQAGGFIIQVLPEIKDDVISKIEENLAKFPNLTDMMDMGHSIEDIISKFILKGLEPEVKQTAPVKYQCDCSKEKFEIGIKLLSKNELQDAIDTNETLTIHCHFCNTDYLFDKKRIEKILEQMKMKKFRHKKSLGQHFLKDKNIVRKIADLAEIEENELVWEIGPGKGILTHELLLQKCDLTCFEIDESLYPILFKKFGTSINLIDKDILKIDWKEYLNDNKLKIVANLPYQITSPFLFRVTEHAANFKRVVVMIQKEVAQRINAGVGTKDYGKLSLKMQFYFNVEYGFTVKPHLFFPPPKVDSAVIILTPRKDKPVLEDERFFWRVVEVAFQNRRKMLRRNLRVILSKEKIEELGASCKIELTRRGETLTEIDFIELYEAIQKLQNKEI